MILGLRSWRHEKNCFAFWSIEYLRNAQWFFKVIFDVIHEQNPYRLINSLFFKACKSQIHATLFLLLLFDYNLSITNVNLKSWQTLLLSYNHSYWHHFLQTWQAKRHFIFVRLYQNISQIEAQSLIIYNFCVCKLQFFLFLFFADDS